MGRYRDKGMEWDAIDTITELQPKVALSGSFYLF